mgnify:CR=1|jgi:hypothetical protein
MASTTSNSAAGFFGTLGHGLWDLSFQLGLTGYSGQSYRASQALSAKDKTLLHALTMGYIQ